MEKYGKDKKPKLWRIYEIIDIDTGEQYKKINNKEFITVSKEITTRKENGYNIETTRRFVRHNGQKKLFD